jgi:hypothetical protein
MSMMATTEVSASFVSWTDQYENGDEDSASERDGDNYDMYGRREESYRQPIAPSTQQTHRIRYDLTQLLIGTEKEQPRSELHEPVVPFKYEHGLLSPVGDSPRHIQDASQNHPDERSQNPEDDSKRYYSDCTLCIFTRKLGHKGNHIFCFAR